MENRRSTDTSKIAQFASNPITVFIHQIITFAAPIALAAIGWVFVTSFNSFTDKLNENTRALRTLELLVASEDAAFKEELFSHERRITRIEDEQDTHHRRNEQ